MLSVGSCTPRSCFGAYSRRLLIIFFSLGVPYHSWRISHAKHHAATCHMSQDQVFIPRTRSELDAPPLDLSGEDLAGTEVSDKIKQELWEALGDSPMGATIKCLIYLVSESSCSPFCLLTTCYRLGASLYIFSSTVVVSRDILREPVVNLTPNCVCLVLTPFCRLQTHGNYFLSPSTRANRVV